MGSLIQEIKNYYFKRIIEILIYTLITWNLSPLEQSYYYQLGVVKSHFPFHNLLRNDLELIFNLAKICEGFGLNLMNINKQKFLLMMEKRIRIKNHVTMYYRDIPS
jgi:Leucine-rich repeat (LRR) protein